MLIKIGQVVNTHGCRGDLKVYPLTDDPRRFLDLSHVYIQREGKTNKYRVLRAKLQKRTVILSLEGVEDMEEAAKMKECYLELPVSELKPLPEGHYYIFQLVGLKVYEEGAYLGELKEVLQTGSNDVYVLQSSPEGSEILLPALKDVIRRIDLESGTMEVKLPSGLLD